MGQESSDKLISGQTDGSSFARVVIVSGKESNHTAIDINQAVVRDSNFVRIEP